MKQIKTDIRIQAPASTVWQVLMDFESYPEWNPFVVEIKGTPTIGNNLETKIKNGEKEFNFKPKVLQNATEEEFRWKGKMWFKGIFDGEHYFQLSESMEGDQAVTEFTHGERFTGILSGMIFRSIGEATRNGFISMNEALKARAEAIAVEV